MNQSKRNTDRKRGDPQKKLKHRRKILFSKNTQPVISLSCITFEQKGFFFHTIVCLMSFGSKEHKRKERVTDCEEEVRFRPWEGVNERK